MALALVPAPFIIMRAVPMHYSYQSNIVGEPSPFDDMFSIPTKHDVSLHEVIHLMVHNTIHVILFFFLLVLSFFVI